MYTRNDQKKMMENPGSWPQFPLLPVKQEHHAWEDKGMGVLFADRQPVVYIVNLWAVHSHEDLINAEKIKFDDFDSLLDAGWIVD